MSLFDKGQTIQLKNSCNCGRIHYIRQEKAKEVFSQKNFRFDATIFLFHRCMFTCFVVSYRHTRSDLLISV